MSVVLWNADLGGQVLEMGGDENSSFRKQIHKNLPNFEIFLV